MAERVEVVVYGATGFTGQLVTARLAELGARFAIAGRSREKLDTLADRFSPRPEVIVADVSDAPSLQGMAARGAVVLSCTGPFTSLGPPVQEACLKAGSHFVDITGELGYMLKTEQSSQRWADAGLTAVNAAGFDVVPTDLAAWLAADGLDPVIRVDIALKVDGFQASQGTLRTATSMLSEPAYAFLDGQWRPIKPGEWIRKMPIGEEGQTYSCVSVPIADVATAPRTTGARSVRTFVAVPRPGIASLAGPLLRAFGGDVGRKLASSGPARWLMKKLVGDGNNGPTGTGRTDACFTATAEANGGGMVKRGWVSGVDPYGLTALTSTAIALRLAREKSVPRGVISPSQAVGDVRAYLGELAPAGVRFGTSVG